jgi:hypothetical protein
MYSTARLLTEEGIEGLGRYYSIYRGIVVDNNDMEKHMNRIKVCCPEVMGGIITWAFPKGQHGSINNGFKYLAPKVGDIVFVTFEFGDPTKPLWEYHGWGLQQIPDPLDGPNKMGIITPEGNVMVLDDDNGKLTVYINGDVGIAARGNISIQAQGDVSVGSGDTVILNKGENQGVVNIKELTEKLNNTIKELETLRALFNSHVHSGVTTGPGSSGPTVTQASQPFSTFKQEDYEDTKCIH